MKGFWRNLKNPQTLSTVASQIVAMLLLVGVRMDEEIVLTVIGMAIGLLSTLGLIHKSESSDLGLYAKRLHCSRSGKLTTHLLIGGRMICRDCGAVYRMNEADEQAEESDDPTAAG